MRKFVALFVLVYAGWVGSVNAATVVMSGGQLMGATGVEVNGASYDVAFLEGSCNSLYNGCTGLPFTTSSESVAASQALLDQVIQPQGISAGTPYLVNGIGAGVVGSAIWGARIMTPTLESWGSVLALALVTLGAAPGWVALPCAGLGCGYTADTSSPTSPYLGDSPIGSTLGDEVFAVWTPAAVSAVPLPAAAWLFGSALLGLIGYSKRKGAKSNA